MHTSIVTRFYSQIAASSRCEEGEIDTDAVDYVIGELKKMKKYFEEENEHIIRDTSLFIVVDSA